MRSQDDQLRDLISEQAAEWYVTCSAEELSQHQASAFMRWLRASPVHVEEYLTLEQVAASISEAARHDRTPLRDLLAGATDEPVPLRKKGPSIDACSDLYRNEAPSPREYRRTHARYGTRQDARSRPRSRLRRALSTAVIAVVVVVGLVGVQRTTQGPVGEIFATGHGELRSIRLSDGTRVQLDSDSAVTVSFDQHNRTVVVDRGRVYFYVRRDSGRPFRVRVGPSLIRDVGTAFDVYRHASSTTVTVSEGHVQIWDVAQVATPPRRWQLWLGVVERPHGEPVADLGADQEITLTKTGRVAQLGRVNAELSLAWRHGRIAFDDQPIASVAAEFNRYNPVQIHVVDRAVGDVRISGVFGARDVQTFVAFLRGLHGVGVKRRGQTVVVYANSHDGPSKG